MNDVTTKVTSISVTPCQDLEVIVELELKTTPIVEYDSDVTTSQKVKSFPSKDAKTFRRPKAQDDVASNVNVAYVKTDLASVEVGVKFVDLVADPTCNKVVDVLIVVRDKNSLSAEPDMYVKRVGIFRELEEVVSGIFVDFCTEYEILARLLGTEGTEPTEVTLATLGPVADLDLESAYLSGYQHEIRATASDLRVQVRSL